MPRGSYQGLNSSSIPICWILDPMWKSDIFRNHKCLGRGVGGSDGFWHGLQFISTLTIVPQLPSVPLLQWIMRLKSLSKLANKYWASQNVFDKFASCRPAAYAKYRQAKQYERLNQPLRGQIGLFAFVVNIYQKPQSLVWRCMSVSYNTVRERSVNHSKWWRRRCDVSVSQSAIFAHSKALSSYRSSVPHQYPRHSKSVTLHINFLPSSLPNIFLFSTEKRSPYSLLPMNTKPEDPLLNYYHAPHGGSCLMSKLQNTNQLVDAKPSQCTLDTNGP